MEKEALPPAKFSKLLTLIVCGRNESYQGNFLYRLSTSINFIARQLGKIDRLDDVEIMVGDWASDEPLSQALPLTPEGRKVCKFVYIPRDVALSIRPDGGFFSSAALNACLRRSKGEFSALYDADSVLPLYSLIELLNLIEGKTPTFFDVKKTFLFLNRHHIPWEIGQSQPTVEELDRYLSVNGGFLPTDQSDYGLGGWGAGHLTHHGIWQELRGYSETLQGYGWNDIEMTLRATQKYPLIHLSGFGIHLFHLEHWPRNKRQGSPIGSKINPCTVSINIEGNGADWGFGNFDLEIQEPSPSPSLPPFAHSTRSIPPMEELSASIKTKENLRASKSFESIMGKFLEAYLSYDINELLDPHFTLRLSWFSLEFMPKSFYYYGANYAYPIGIVAQNTSTVSLNLVHLHENTIHSQWPIFTRISSILREVNFHGETRHLTGDPSTALSRLLASSPENHKIDMAIVQNLKSTDDTVRELRDLIPHLASPACLFIMASSTEQLEEIISASSGSLTPLLRMPSFSENKTGFLKG